MKDSFLSPSAKLYVVLAAFFIANAIVAEFIGIKIFSLEASLGFDDFEWSLFGQKGNLQFTAGVLLWPFVFILTDIINDYFGTRGVKYVTYLTMAIIVYAFAMVFIAISLAPAPWWNATGEAFGLDNMQVAFAGIFGQGLWVIGGSLVAFFLGQLLDAFIFKKIKQKTGDGKIWMRATFSTVIGQLIDSYVVLYIAFVLGPQKWTTDLFVAIGTVNFLYKIAVAILLIPLLYLIHGLIAKYLGKANAHKLRESALLDA